jgi:hypothetical protein
LMLMRWSGVMLSEVMLHGAGATSGSSRAPGRWCNRWRPARSGCWRRCGRPAS